MPSAFQFQLTRTALLQGAVIAYPTEAVYGLGCNPLDKVAVERLLAIKNRSVDKGLILIASRFEQLQPYLAELDRTTCQPAFDSWPGPNTWLFPVNADTPYWLTGRHSTLAVRVSAHPVVRQLCDTAGMPLVSTSCNRNKQRPARTALEAQLRCPEVDMIINGPVNRQARPSVIRDLLSGKTLRI